MARMEIKITKERIRGINISLRETKMLLMKAKKRLRDAKVYLEMEKKENKMLGNAYSANTPAIMYVKSREKRIIQLEKHIKKLNSMKKRKTIRL